MNYYIGIRQIVQIFERDLKGLVERCIRLIFSFIKSSIKLVKVFYCNKSFEWFFFIENYKFILEMKNFLICRFLRKQFLNRQRSLIFFFIVLVDLQVYMIFVILCYKKVIYNYRDIIFFQFRLILQEVFLVYFKVII